MQETDRQDPAVADARSEASRHPCAERDVLAEVQRLVEIDRLMDEIDRLYGQEGVDFVFGLERAQ